jgi:3-oxoacyl-[acyl-carrier protein] reductase
MERERVPLTEAISLKGQCAVITGASSGIGRAISSRFAEAGANLMLLDINKEGLNNTISGFMDRGGIYTPYTTDLSQKNEINSFWKNINSAEPRIIPDILINNVGIYPEQDFLKVTEDGLKKVVDLNLNSTFWMCQDFIKLRGKKGGVIVNISSVEALLPFKEDMVPYSVSKAGVLALTRALARDYGRKGFRVNAVIPGAIRTPGTGSMMLKAITNFRLDLVKTGYIFQQRLANGRWGNPDEVAKMVLTLSSNLASYVQGAAVPVDGGFLSS